MKRTDKNKALQLGLALLESSRFDKQAFIEANGTLTRKEVADLLGCSERNVVHELAPSFYNKNHPLWIRKEVIAFRDKKVKAEEERRKKNKKMLRESAAA